MCSINRLLHSIYVMERTIKVETGLSLVEVMVLSLLNEHIISAGDMARDIGLSAGRISRIISHLEDDRLISRGFDDVDKRRIRFVITGEGASMLDRIKEIAGPLLYNHMDAGLERHGHF